MPQLLHCHWSTNSSLHMPIDQKLSSHLRDQNKIRAANAFRTLRARKASKSWKTHHRIHKSGLTAPPNWKISAFISISLPWNMAMICPKQSHQLHPRENWEEWHLRVYEGRDHTTASYFSRKLKLHLALEFSPQAHPNMIKISNMFMLILHVWDHVISCAHLEKPNGVTLDAMLSIV